MASPRIELLEIAVQEAGSGETVRVRINLAQIVALYEPDDYVNFKGCVIMASGVRYEFAEPYGFKSLLATINREPR